MMPSENEIRRTILDFCEYRMSPQEYVTWMETAPLLELCLPDDLALKLRDSDWLEDRHDARAALREYALVHLTTEAETLSSCLACVRAQRLTPHSPTRHAGRFFYLEHIPSRREQDTETGMVELSGADWAIVGAERGDIARPWLERLCDRIQDLFRQASDYSPAMALMRGTCRQMGNSPSADEYLWSRCAMLLYYLDRSEQWPFFIATNQVDEWPQKYAGHAHWIVGHDAQAQTVTYVDSWYELEGAPAAHFNMHGKDPAILQPCEDYLL